MNLWKRKPALGIGIGVSLVGAVALAARYGFRRAPRERIPMTYLRPSLRRGDRDDFRGDDLPHFRERRSRSVPAWNLSRSLFLRMVESISALYLWPECHRSRSDRLWRIREAGSNDGCHRLFRKPGRILRNTCGDRTPIVVASGLTAGIALLMASRHPERVSRLILLLPTGLKEPENGVLRHGCTCRARPEPLRLSKLSFPSPFIRGWLTKFALEIPSRLNEEMVRALTTCAQQVGAEHAILDFPRAARLRHRVAPGPGPTSGEYSLARARLRLSSRGRGRDLAKAPRSRIIPVPDCGILAALEAPAVLTSIIAAELDGDFRLEGVACCYPGSFPALK